MERLAPSSSSSHLVKGYSTLFCTIDKHDWPQLGQLQPILMSGTNWWQGLYEQLSSSSPCNSHHRRHLWVSLWGSWKRGISCGMESTSPQAETVWKMQTEIKCIHSYTCSTLNCIFTAELSLFHGLFCQQCLICQYTATVAKQQLYD